MYIEIFSPFSEFGEFWSIFLPLYLILSITFQFTQVSWISKRGGYPVKCHLVAK